MALTAPVTELVDGEPPAPRGPEPARMPAGRAILVLFLTLLLAGLLSSADVLRVAREQPFGTRRDLALDVARPLARTAAFLSLDRPRQWLESATNEGADDKLDDVALPPPSTVPAPAPPSTTPTASTTVTTIPPTTTTLPERRVPTPDAPVKVLFAGDSLAGNMSDEFIRLVRDDPRVDVTTDVHVSTGLARPDVLNWPAQLATLIDARQPDVVMLMIGANDDQTMVTASGHHVVPGTDEWRAEYELRVAQMMDIASAGGRTVVWVELPIVAPDRLNQVKDVVDGVVETEAAARPTVRVVNSAPLLAGPDGGYTDFLTDSNGLPVKVREHDGVHITHAGCDFVTPAILSAFAADWHLDTPWEPPTTTTTTTPPLPPPTSGP
jgi:hypothetical protein